MSKRLIEVANELNVSTKIIVEHLRHNGFEEVNDKPTSKLSVGMYDQLVKHFRNAIAIKEQADQLSNTSGLKKKEERSNSSKDKLRPWERPMLVNKEPKSLIRDSSAITETTTDEQKTVSKTPVAENNNENISEKIANNETPPVDKNQQQENTPSDGQIGRAHV